MSTFHCWVEEVEFQNARFHIPKPLQNHLEESPGFVCSFVSQATPTPRTEQAVRVGFTVET